MDYLTDPREIRSRLNEAAYQGGRIDGYKFGIFDTSFPAALAREVFVAAEAQGLSGEDTMTLLAYHALLNYEDALDRLINQWNTSPASVQIIKG